MVRSGRWVVALAAVALGSGVVAPASAGAGARHETSFGGYVVQNPCTGEDVDVTGVFHYLIFGKGDLTHTARGTGVGLVSGTSYVYVRQGTETGRGFFETVRLISAGPASDLILTDDMGDDVPPVITCT